MVEKYINEDGKVGVIVSPGWGAGWSTWACSNQDFYCMDAGLVQLCLEGASEVELEQYLEYALPLAVPEGTHLYAGGWEDCHVVWLEPGTVFTIEEHDGNESLRTVDNLSMTA